jgi:outer membrane protein assembly factor BamB
MRYCSGSVFIILALGLLNELQAEGVRFNKEPGALPPGAVTSDWPGFLGPEDQPISPETKLLPELTEAGPSVVWEMDIGAGYASPSIVGDKLIFFDRVGDKEQITCCSALSGKQFWRHEYPVQYEDRYGYAAGPRASAVIAGDQVFTFGVTSWLLATDLATGKVLWEHDCAKEFGVPQYFFGSGSSPLVVGDLVVVNLGGTEDRCVVAFERSTGKVKWTTKHAWSQSYASPIPMELQGKKRVLVFAGGESKPSTGGLLAIDPLTGDIDDAYAWRATRYTSVNAASPCRCGPNRVFITQAYVDSGSDCNGGVMLEMTEERKWRTLWRAPAFGSHWMTPVYHNGHLYAFSGEKEHVCDLVCYEAATGKLLWKESPSWDMVLKDGRKLSMGFKRGSLLHVDGRFLCLGEWGSLAWLDLTPEGMKISSRTQPFVAQQSWTMPVVSHGLLYLCQHEKDELSERAPRMLCYDFRAPATK